MTIEKEQTAAVSFEAFTKKFGISRWTLARAAARGEVRTIYLAGRRFVPRAEVERIELMGFGSGRKRSKKAAQ
jgi:hypothetical protein